MSTNPLQKPEASVSGVTAPRRTQQERTAESTQRLLEAAIELIAEKGFSATTSAEIGERAGYSRSMVQFRYGTKEALLESVLRDEYETRVLAQPSSGSTGLQRVLEQIDRLHDEVAENPELMRAFFVLCFESLGPVQSLRAWIGDWLSRYEAATITSIRAGIADGTIRQDIEPDVEAGALLAGGIGQAFRWTAAPDEVDLLAALQAMRARIEARLSAPESKSD
jgi:AcrR family transcriptional regulator